MNQTHQTTVAVAQLEHSPEADPLERALQAIERAASQGAGLIAFPETWLPGYPAWLDVCPAARAGITVVMGAVERKNG